MTDYDQVDEVKLMLDNRELVCQDGSTSRFLVTLSSASDQGSVEENTSDNDFVFLPAPNQIPSGRNSQKHLQQQHERYPQNVTAGRSHFDSQAFKPDFKGPTTIHDRAQQKSSINLASTNPLLAINRGLNQGNNPFGNAPQKPSSEINEGGSRKHRYASSAFECFRDSIKPIGLLELSPAVANNKMDELMRQIVTRSDSMLIAIPCTYCSEPVTCPPADITNWLNHMSIQHNCKVCPVCNRLVGLGQARDLEIMRRHVVEDLDENWLERRANKESFTFGLQQQWYAGNQCIIRETRYK